MVGKTAIIEFLHHHNIHDVFYLPGIHTLSLSEALRHENVRVIVPRHESSMVFMADGFARVSGRTGVVIVTPGPGLGNVVTGCMEAHGDDIPLLIIHIDTGRDEIGKGILHELADPECMFRQITKKTFAVQGKDDFAATLECAYLTANSPRKGPVLVSIPYTLLEKEVSSPLDQTEKAALSTVDGLPDMEKILAPKERPVIIGGKALMTEEARPLLDKICSTSSIPFFTTTSGKGILNETNPWCFGNVTQKGVVKNIIASADLTIALGTRLRDVDTRRRGVKIRDLLHIDVDEAWLHRNYRASYSTAGEMLFFLHHLEKATLGRTFRWALQELKDAQQKEREHLRREFLGFQLMDVINTSVPSDTVTVWDLNLAAYWAEYYYTVHDQGTFIMPRGTSPIFYALPAALGAKMARPDTPCLAVCGDGSILPAMGEIATLRTYNLPIIILLLNNNSYGILEDAMETSYGLNGLMTLQNPDFVTIASAFGVKGARVTKLEELKTILERVISGDEPFFIEFVAPVFSPPWRAVP